MYRDCAPALSVAPKPPHLTDATPTELCWRVVSAPMEQLFQSAAARRWPPRRLSHLISPPNQSGRSRPAQSQAAAGAVNQRVPYPRRRTAPPALVRAKFGWPRRPFGDGRARQTSNRKLAAARQLISPVGGRHLWTGQFDESPPTRHSARSDKFELRLLIVAARARAAPPPRGRPSDAVTSSAQRPTGKNGHHKSGVGRPGRHFDTRM